jgi:1-acyl-sn-glycerol-3-phosphate acyltransferase
VASRSGNELEFADEAAPAKTSTTSNRMSPSSIALATLRDIRAAFRLVQVALLIVGGIATARLLFPHWSAERCKRIKQAWSRRLVASLGVRIESTGEPATHGLVVSNHISWLDVFVINAITPTTFVCKEDVRHWPAIGDLVAYTGTLFIERGSRTAAARSAHAMTARLRSGERVAIFPEGTTTGGNQLLPFKPALFEAAASAHAPVQALTLRYTDKHGAHSRATAYDGDISFGQSLVTIARSSGLKVHIDHLAPQAAGLDRREHCRCAEQSIAAHLDLHQVGSETLQALAA